MSEKKVMIQTMMSIEDFAFCQDLFKHLDENLDVYISDKMFYRKSLIFDMDNLESIKHLRRIFLPDIRIL